MKRIVIAYGLAALAGMTVAADAIPCSGTLVIFFPTKDGIVAAADSRRTVSSEPIAFLDDAEKLRVIQSQNLVFAVTGNDEFFEVPPKGADLKAWVASHKPIFDFDEEIEKFFAEHKQPILVDQALCEALAKFVVKSVNDFSAKSPSTFNGCKGRPLCRVILGQVDRKADDRIIASVSFTMDSTGEPHYEKPEIYKSKPGDDAPGTERACGETDYLLKNVLNGYGKQFLGPEFEKRIMSAKKISDRTSSDAGYLAYRMITATAKTTEKIPADWNRWRGEGVLDIRGRNSADQSNGAGKGFQD